jgi:hypothetical protein
MLSNCDKLIASLFSWSSVQRTSFGQNGAAATLAHYLDRRGGRLGLISLKPKAELISDK